MRPQSLGLIAFCHLASGLVDLPDHGPITGWKVGADLSLNQPLKQDVVNYLGIPFAEPPVGNLRFRPPQKYIGSWDQPRAFEVSQKDCMAGLKGSEDCLYLNVFVPASASKSNPLPVMFWIYGGGFSFGRVSMYNGTALAAQEDVIVVVPSYRFGPLGFLANQATLDESGTTGNWGILDQRMALEWVNSNIEHFGGDKNKITIFGESAGAISVATHMSSPGSQGLFHRAIVQSAVLDLDLFYLEKEDSFRFYDWMAKNLTHCSNGEDMDCLRKVPASRFFIPESIRDNKDKAPTWAASLFPFFAFGTTKDGNVVLGSPVEMALAGKTANVPLIVGLTQDEGTVFAFASPTIVRPKPQVPPTEADAKAILEYFIGDKEFVKARFEAEFPAHRAVFKHPDDSDYDEKCPDNNFFGQFKAAKIAKWHAYRAKNIRESEYVNVDDLVHLQKRMDAEATPLFNDAYKKKLFQMMFDQFLSKDLGAEKFEDIVRQAPKLAQFYNESKGSEGEPLNTLPYDRAPLSFLTSTARDVIFSCPSLEFAAAHRDAGNKVFFYNLAFDVWNGTIFYDVGMSVAGVKDGGDIAIADLGVFHGADIPLVFKLFKSKPTHLNDPNLFALFHFFTGNQVSKPGDAAHQVADQIGCYWANLARCGDVNCQKTCHGRVLTEWPAISNESHKFMNIQPDGEFTVMEHQQSGFAGVGAPLPSNDQCEAWSKAEFRYLDIRHHNNKMRQGAQHRYV
jgi:carboxylesterase type B